MPPNQLRLRPLAGLVAACALGAAGCQTAPPAADQTTVARLLSERVGHTVPAGRTSGEVTLPPGAAFEDGVTEDEAVAIALWNNAAFQELLGDLGLTRGDLIQAGLLPQPGVFGLLPGDRQAGALPVRLRARVCVAAADPGGGGGARGRPRR